MPRQLRDMRVSTKIMSSFLVVGLLLGVVAVLGLVQLHRAQVRLQTMSEQSVAGQQALGDVKTGSQRTTKDLVAVALAPSDDSLQTFTEDLQEVRNAWDAYKATSPDVPTDQLEAVDAALGEYKSGATILATVARSGDQATFMSMRNDESLPVSEGGIGHGSVNDTLGVVQDTATANAQREAAEGAAAYASARLLLLGVSVLAVALSVVLALLISRSVARPLNRTRQVAEALAAGRLDERVEVSSHDEVGRTAQALNTAIDQLTGTISDIRRGADELQEASSGLGRVSERLATGAGESSAQADVVLLASSDIAVNVTTVAAAGDEMSAAIREIAASTADASQVASSAVTSAEGARVTIERLSASSREIGDVVKLITSIAEQTNLLALNATIEAARAGEMGKGFAVVAGEVKELAQQTARATESITARVSATQTDAVEAAAAIGEIADVIARIDGLQATIAAAVEEQSATTAEMVRNVTEVSNGSAEITANISGIAQAAGRTTQDAGATQTAADEVAGASQRLRQAVSVFQL